MAQMDQLDPMNLVVLLVREFQVTQVFHLIRYLPKLLSVQLDLVVQDCLLNQQHLDHHLIPAIQLVLVVLRIRLLQEHPLDRHYPAVQAIQEIQLVQMVRKILLLLPLLEFQ